MRSCLLPLAVLAVAATAADADASSPSARATGPDPLADRLRERIPALMEEAVIPGAQLALVRDGSISWTGAFGEANAGTGAPVSNESVFEAASLSKPVFAYAVLKLVDAGQLDLDAPLSTYLPGGYDVPDDARLGLITARHVLSHRSGFPNWRGNQRLRILFTPGERFSYSGEGFVYLAAAVERITGESLEGFVRRRVFGPLAMASSSFVWQARDESSKVFGHTVLGDVAGRETPWRANAAASLHTTAADYARFLAAAVSGAGLRPATAREMTSPQSWPDEVGIDTSRTPPTGRRAAGVAWGLGFGLEQDGDSWALWHWGDNGPNKAFVMTSADRRLGLVAFLDSENGLTMVPGLLAEVFPGPRPSLAWLRLASNPALQRFVRTLRRTGVASALDEYRAGRVSAPDADAIPEDALNRLGYALLGAGKAREAVAVFEQNVADHPESWNVYDSLGEALAADDQVDEAIKAYTRSLELNPDNAGGAEALGRLRDARGLAVGEGVR